MQVWPEDDISNITSYKIECLRDGIRLGAGPLPARANGGAALEYITSIKADVERERLFDSISEGGNQIDKTDIQGKAYVLDTASLQESVSHEMVPETVCGSPTILVADVSW